MTERLDAGCAAVRPLLFAAVDGEVTRDERHEVHAHLAMCESCRSWERAERALTSLLTEPRPSARRRVRARSRLLVFPGALAAAALVLLLLPSAAPRASLVECRLGPGCEWQVSGERVLADDAVVDVPAAAAATVRLGDTVRLDAVGPARFVLDARERDFGVTVHTGAVEAAVSAHASLVVGQQGAQRLGSGRWLLSPARVAALAPSPQDPVPADTAAQLAEGLGQFQRANIAIMEDAASGTGSRTERERGHLAAAERLLRTVLAAQDVTAEQERIASFYLAASVSRQGRAAEAFGHYEQWLARHPDGDEASVVRFFMAVHLRDVGRHAEARVLFERVRADEGDTPLGTAAQGNLERVDRSRAGAQRAARLPADDAPLHAARAVPPHGRGPGAYLVVPVALDAARAADAGYVAAARAARAFHGGDEWAWDGEDFASLERTLRERAPANVLFVLRPERLDLVLHRRVLLLSAKVDDDWFADFCFGWLTAEDGAGCERLWQRIAKVHGKAPLGGLWWQSSVTSNATSLVHENAPPSLAAAAGFRGPHYWFSSANDDRDAMIERAFATIGRASVVEITGCGDPQGIWLFDDARNLQRDRHWDYAPQRVGEDPGGAMPRLLAQRFRSLQLDAPILWSGTCHCGAVRRVFVEADIVSTFGRTERTTVHELEPRDSLALSWLAAGASSLLVPLGANHGMSVSMEVDFALRNGASLGETIKSTYDDVLLAAKGDLVLDLPVVGEPHGHDGEIMQGGGANRILIGDPALRPFRAVTGDAEVVTAERTDAGLRVTVTRTGGWQPRAWDMFGGERTRDWRVLVRVDLGELGLLERTQFSATVSARSADGAALPYTMQRLAIEDDHGKRWLHAQCNGPRAPLDGKACAVVFEIAAK